MWQTRTINIGTIKPKEKRKVTFVWDGELPKISTVAAGCGCTKPTIKDNTIEVAVRIKQFPKHLTVDKVPIRKSLLVIYPDTLQPDILYIEGNLTRR